MNPDRSEIIDFYHGYEDKTIEIAQPSAFWPDLDDNVRWDIAVDSDKSSMIKIVTLSTYVKFGKTFQRFRIDHSYQDVVNAESRFLGAVFLFCREKEMEKGSFRKISCWITPATLH